MCFGFWNVNGRCSFFVDLFFLQKVPNLIIFEGGESF